MQEYLDTSALMALSDSRDANHDRAARHMQDALSQRVRFTIGKPVLVEFIDGVMKRVGKGKAVDHLRAILDSKVVSLVLETGPDWKKAVSIFLEHDDTRIDLTDALSFSIMERLGIGTAFTFDSDFKARGFAIVP